jgi:aminopeptidase N
MKNWFDNFNGHENDKPFILNGGHYVKQWVNDLLTSKRDEDKMGKEIKSVVLPNQFNDTHQKDNIEDMNRPSKSHSSAVNRMNEEVTENLKRINELIKKII